MSVGKQPQEKEEMKEKEAAYLILNVPFCLVSFIVLAIVSQGLNYQYSNWNPSAEATVIGIFLLLLILDFIMMGWLKMFNKRTVFFTVVELTIMYLLLAVFFLPH